MKNGAQGLHFLYGSFLNRDKSVVYEYANSILYGFIFE
jgi:hypothetical protein